MAVAPPTHNSAAETLAGLPDPSWVEVTREDERRRATRGKTLQFGAKPGTTFILPRGTVHELKWEEPTHRIAVALHPCLLVSAFDETAHESDIELTEHWN